MRNQHCRHAEQHDRPAPADAGDQPRAEQRHGNRAHVAAGDVRRNGKAATVLGKLLGQQSVAHRVLRRAADTRRDIGRGKAAKGGRKCLGRKATAEDEPAHAQQRSARDVARQPRVRELDEAGRDVARGDEQRNGGRVDPELGDDREVDQRQQRRLGMIDGVGDRQQPEIANWVKVLLGGHRGVGGRERLLRQGCLRRLGGRGNKCVGVSHLDRGY